MANRTLRVLLKKIYTDGSIDTIYLKSRAADVFVDGSSSTSLSTYVSKVDGIQEGATAVAAGSTNGYITINGTSTEVYTHPNSGVTAGTYSSVTVNAAGHVTAGTNPGYLTSSSVVTFTEASSKANIVSNSDTLAVMLGKLSKWYSSFGSLAWLSSVGSSNLDSTLATQYAQRVVTGTANQTASVTTSREITAAGYAADARAVANLQNQIDTINSNAIKNISRSGVTFTATKLNNTTFTFTQQDNNTTYATYKGATTAASGTAGLVPAATTANRLKFLRGDAAWAIPTNTTYGAVTTAANGLMTAADKIKLNDLGSISSGSNFASMKITDNLIILYGAYTLTNIAITNPYGTSYYYNFSITLNPAFPNYAYCASATAYCNGGIYTVSLTTLTKNKVTGFIWSTSSEANRSPSINLIILGY